MAGNDQNLQRLISKFLNGLFSSLAFTLLDKEGKVSHLIRFCIRTAKQANWSAITSVVCKIAWVRRNGELEIRERKIKEKIPLDKSDSLSNGCIKVVTVFNTKREKK